MKNKGNVDKVIKGAKILTLYKQHYLEEYEEPLETEYSCWGYFDGMDITDVYQRNSALFEKKSNSALSDIWYQTVEINMDQNGRFSQQNIGLLRYEEVDDEQNESVFWNVQHRKIFLSVCFIQFRDKSVIYEFRKNLERRSDDNVQILTYFTFDNADLVAFLQSNSFADITGKIHQIDSDFNVAYVHPISGVLEKNLRSDKAVKEYHFSDSAGNELKNDKVQEIRISIVGNAGTFEQKLNYLMNRLNNSLDAEVEPLKMKFCTYMYMAEHVNYIYSFRNTDMRTLLALLIPDGLLTHKNGLYGKQIYNMETHIIFEEKELKHCPIDKLKKEVHHNKESWCRCQLEQYKNYMKMAKEIDDEGLYSYCRAVVQTLNTLAQFENFPMSKNIFYIIYPAFKLFSIQLSQANDVFNSISSEKRKKVMNAIMDFLDSINSIMYHAIHTDQTFLMVPGYSGTSFSIPTKLSLFYLWYLESVSRILNDTDNWYGFYLTPVMESKPYTYLVDFGLPPEDRLICVKVSQRSLYMPRALLIILAHETAHYVGHDMRKRISRWKYVKETMAGIIALALIPYWYINQCEEFYGKNCRIYLEDKIRECYDYIEKKLQDIFHFHEQRLNAEGQDEERVYHVLMVNVIMKNGCAEILADENSKLRSIIYGNVEEFHKYANTFEEQIEFGDIIEKVVDSCEKRRIQLLGSSKCDQIIDELLRDYQEIFADISAKIILDFELEDYLMAFNISEGYKIEESLISQNDYIRHQIMQKIFFEKTEGDKELDKESDQMGEQKDILEYWTYLDIVEKNMRDYASECKKELEAHLSRECHSELLCEIRKALNIFSSKKYGCKEIYEFIDEKAKKYSEMIDEKMKNNPETA